MNDIPPIPADAPGPTEVEFGRETCEMISREMLLTADAEMAIVRIFGSDRSGNAVRIGVTPERALRLGAAFIRAGLRVNPALRASLVSDTAGAAVAEDLEFLTQLRQEATPRQAGDGEPRR